MAARAGSAWSAATISSGFTRALLRSRITSDGRALRAAVTTASGDRVNAICTPTAFAAEEIRELTRGRGATLVLDCVGTNATLAMGTQVVAKGGDVLCAEDLPANALMVPEGPSRAIGESQRL